MPFVLGSDDCRRLSNKRRKLSPEPAAPAVSIMARYRDTSMAADSEHDSGDSEATGTKENRMIEFPAEIARTSSREELMECLKRGKRPAFVPQNGFQALREEEEALVALRKLRSTSTEQPPAASDTSLTQELPIPISPVNQPLNRPRSALHRGNFADGENAASEDYWPHATDQPGLALSTSGNFNASPPPWLADSPRPTAFNAMSHVRSLSQLNTSFGNRRRAPSLGSSLSSSFVMRTPTSPLVQATSNIDLDLTSTTEQPTQPARRSDDRRRRTMPPNSFHSLSMTPIDITPNFSRPFAPILRREASMPTQSHRHAQSLSSFTYHPRSNPPTPLQRSRRPSMTSESHSRRRTSMVVSFEESILRGRMSTPPSKPLDFVAQIGVMGKGDCSSNLKCPAHVTVPFPAVFYSYPASAGARSVSDDTPSPYVGTVDLNNNLKSVTLAVNKRRNPSSLGSPGTDGFHSVEEAPKLHVGGAYRVPQQGQLQIIIKNPNKTAVKLFLVPYDLSGMQPASKTFVRQRSFSTGPIIENVLGDKQTKAGIVDPLENKHILRYLIHLKFCCPAKNRFYLYDDIRVVFANRVPDGKEKLRNEVQLPEPKFSLWKSMKKEIQSNSPNSAPNTPTMNTFEIESPQFFGDMDDFRRPTSPVSPTPSGSLQPGKSRQHTIFEFSHSSKSISSPQRPSQDLTTDPTRLLSFAFPDIERPQTPTKDAKIERARSPITGFGTNTPLRGSPIPWRSPPSGNGSHRSFSPIPAEPTGDGLLSKQFRELNGSAGQKPPSRNSTQ